MLRQHQVERLPIHNCWTSKWILLRFWVIIDILFKVLVVVVVVVVVFIRHFQCVSTHLRSGIGDKAILL